MSPGCSTTTFTEIVSGYCSCISPSSSGGFILYCYISFAKLWILFHRF
uniref:Uncharacterized protein n=1 Tax=Zea mays TaxID=4577 RepID=C4J7L4_MAIZE|nr:unknown [Zea mays]